MQEKAERELPNEESAAEEDSQQPAEAQVEPKEETQAQEPSAASQIPDPEVRNGSEGGEEADDGPVASDGGDEQSGFIAAFQELRKWVDTNDAQYAALHAEYEACQGRPASGIK